MSVRAAMIAQGLVLSAGLCGCLMAGGSPVPTANNDDKGVIAKTVDDGRPVIWKFVDELPPAEVRHTLPWLTVISWKFDPDIQNGMPPEDIMQRMMGLEKVLRMKVEEPSTCRHVYSRTGNGLRELVYQVQDRDAFTESLNSALRDVLRYPIEISFYSDPDWADFQKLLDAQHRAQQKPF